jgi:hypothetical protein
MVGQPSDNDGTYNENNVPWKQHDSIPEEEWQSIGELNMGGSNKVKVWKRIQINLS